MRRVRIAYFTELPNLRQSHYFLGIYFVMASTMVNVLLTSFPGLGLPKTLSLPVPSTLSIADLHDKLVDRIPSFSDRLILTTLSNKQLDLHSSSQLTVLLQNDQDEFLSLRLSARLCGGKGGFGSQLRAAGGRMSSKKKKNQGDSNGSSRNLDGRRLRTVTEAKALAEYLAIKPDMEKKEKDLRKQRWEQVIELAEKREEDIKSGSKSKIDGKWVEDKEEAEERTREAVLAAMTSGDYTDSLTTRSASTLSLSSSNGNSQNDSAAKSSPDGTPPPLAPAKSQVATEAAPKIYFGFDEDDEYMSEDEDEDESDEVTAN